MRGGVSGRGGDGDNYMNGCNKYEYLVARFVHGEILLQEKEDLEAHLAVCAKCERLYEDIARLDRVLREMPGKLVDPPASLRGKILANLPEEKPAPADRRWWGWAAAVGAAAACALLAVSLHRADAPKDSRVSSVAPAPAGPAAPAPARIAPVPPPSVPAPPPAVASAAQVQVIREVKIYFYYPPAQKVAVTGDFNGWDRDGVPLTRAGKPGLWETNLRLRPGAYSYNFIVDGDVLVPDPNAPDQTPDGYGGTNSILLVKGEKSA